MNDDVAAVIRKCLQADPTHRYEGMGNASIDVRSAAEAILPALAAAGYAVVKVPGGVTVNHGARLSKWTPGGWLYAIEDAP